jgi:co-chaperonin GroES (HSP10)
MSRSAFAFPLDGVREMPEDLVLARPSRVWKATRFSGPSNIETPVIVEVLAHQSRDKVFFGDIVAQGLGVEVNGQRNPMVGARGDVFIANDNTISYRTHEKGVAFYVFRNTALMALLDPETFVIQPVQHYILVRENEKAALALSSSGGIWLPTTDTTTDDEGERHNGGLRAEYGEVVAVGPGAWIDGQFKQPKGAPGDMILYDCSHSTLNVTLRGVRFTLVASTQEATVYRGAAELYR